MLLTNVIHQRYRLLTLTSLHVTYDTGQTGEEKNTNHNQTLSCTNLFTWIVLNLSFAFLPPLYCTCTRHFVTRSNPRVVYVYQFMHIFTSLLYVIFLICRCFVFYLRIPSNLDRLFIDYDISHPPSIWKSRWTNPVDFSGFEYCCVVICCTIQKHLHI